MVLSLNDGCIVSRSDEAKALGVKMGQPVFQVQALIRVAPTFVLLGYALDSRSPKV